MRNYQRGVAEDKMPHCAGSVLHPEIISFFARLQETLAYDDGMQKRGTQYLSNQWTDLISVDGFGIKRVDSRTWFSHLRAKSHGCLNSNLKFKLQPR